MKSNNAITNRQPKNVAKNNRVEIHINGHKKPLNIAKNTYKCGDRILITKQKNNKPKWIIDWINHYTHRYNVTNIVIFDNNSDDFEGLKRQLESFSHVSLIPYNFPFGVPRQFPSNFLQHNLMEIAFQQFCKDDTFIFNFDIHQFKHPTSITIIPLLAVSTIIILGANATKNILRSGHS